MDSKYELREFFPKDASEADFEAFVTFENKMRQERQPGDPPRSLESVKANLQSIPPFVHLRLWLVWDVAETAVVAQATFVYLDTGENQHLGQVDLDVLPAHRRQGMATELLALIVAEAESQGRTLLMGNTNGRAPAGEQLMLRLGGSRGLATHQNQLVLAEVAPSLLQRWLDEAPTAEFSLGLWLGAYPEEQLEAIVALHEVMNQQPRGDLDVEDSRLTAEQLRQIEANQAAQGVVRWTMYVAEKGTGKLAGYTELYNLPDRADLVSQGDTAVFPAYRGRGLGRWLKAAIVEKLMAERPSVQFIRTTNADSNAAMLKINREMGFRPYLSQTIWQIETAKVKAYLAGE
ncbi:MAG: GNAT family N-acetyltransferase [Chloroflexota bacterium]